MYARKYYLFIYRRNHLVHHSLFHFHFFTFFSPFSLLFLSLSPPISPTIHSSLPYNIRDKD